MSPQKLGAPARLAATLAAIFVPLAISPRSAAPAPASSTGLSTFAVSGAETLQSSSSRRVQSTSHHAAAPAKPTRKSRPCDVAPCKNGATCTNMRAGRKKVHGGQRLQYTCVCAQGFEGQDCAQQQRSVHVNIELLTSGGSEAVVVDGATTPEFDKDKPSFEVAADRVRLSMTNIDAAAKRVNFKQPVVVTDHPEMLSPSFVGQARYGGMLNAHPGLGQDTDDPEDLHAAARVLVIEHRCLKAGSGRIAISIPFSNGFNATFGWVKTCSQDAPAKINVKRTGIDGSLVAVFSDGNLDPSFDAAMDLPQLFETRENATTFILSAIPSQSKRDHVSVTMKRPAIRTDYPAANPVLTGKGAKGATISSDVDITVKHNCHQNVGMVGVTLALSFASYSSINLSWKVNCGGGTPRGLIVESGGSVAVDDGECRKFLYTIKSSR